MIFFLDAKIYWLFVNNKLFKSKEVSCVNWLCTSFYEAMIPTIPMTPRRLGSKWSDTFSASPSAKIKKPTWKLSRHEKETKRSGTPKKPHIFCRAVPKNLPDLYWSPAQLGSGSCLTSKKIKAMRNLKPKPRQNETTTSWIRFFMRWRKPNVTHYHHMKDPSNWRASYPRNTDSIVMMKMWFSKKNLQRSTVSGIFG